MTGRDLPSGLHQSSFIRLNFNWQTDSHSTKILLIKHNSHLTNKNIPTYHVKVAAAFFQPLLGHLLTLDILRTVQVDVAPLTYVLEFTDVS